MKASYFVIGWLFTTILLGGGCVSPIYIHPKDYALSTDPQTKALNGKWHSVRILPAPSTPVVHTSDKLNPIWWLGNADQPKPPPDYLAGHHLRNLKWHLRNPIHNLDNYVIGLSDKDIVRSGKYPTRVGNPHGGWNFAVCKRGFWRLPFVDYGHKRFEFYFGWRTGANFGIKLNFRKTDR